MRNFLMRLLTLCPISCAVKLEQAVLICHIACFTRGRSGSEVCEETQNGVISSFFSRKGRERISAPAGESRSPALFLSIPGNPDISALFPSSPCWDTCLVGRDPLFCDRIRRGASGTSRFCFPKPEYDDCALSSGQVCLSDSPGRENAGHARARGTTIYQYH